jgi:hypothetical protein
MQPSLNQRSHANIAFGSILCRPDRRGKAVYRDSTSRGPLYGRVQPGGERAARDRSTRPTTSSEASPSGIQLRPINLFPHAFWKKSNAFAELNSISSTFFESDSEPRRQAPTDLGCFHTGIRCMTPSSLTSPIYRSKAAGISRSRSFCFGRISPSRGMRRLSIGSWKGGNNEE